MSNWLITWINKGKFKNQQVIPEAYVNEAMSSQMVIGAGLPDKEFPDMHLSNYVYAWFLSSYKGHYRVEHGGNIDGFSANVAFFPSDSIGIVVLTNQNGSSVPNLVRNTVADRLLKAEKTDWAKYFTAQKLKAKKALKESKAETPSPKINNTRPSHILQDYTGTYSNPGYGEFSIVNKNDSLFANFRILKFYLMHKHYDVFEPMTVTKTGIDTTDTGALRINFATNDSGDIASAAMKMEPMLDHAIAFKHTPTVIDVDKAILEKYAGEYMLSGMTLKVYSKQDKLYLFVPGQPEYELLATGKYKFSIKTLEGYKVEFAEADDKSINAMILIQPNGTFKTTKK